MDKARVKRFIFRHIIVFFVLLFVLFIYKCPFYYFLHVPCPGCGISRAYMAAFHLDFKSAFQYHPLFLTTLPLVLYISHRRVLKKQLSHKAETICAVGLSILFIVVYIIRILNGLI